jgi:DNA-binding NarL/FixJ family response regulator
LQFPHSEFGVKQLGALTKREQQVASLVYSGLPNKIIAQKLNLSEGTVKQHIHRIFQKLGVRNRSGLIIALSDRVRL